MSRADLAKSDCAVARAIERVGDPWTLMILRAMFLGARRFDQLERATGASPHILSERLKRLCADGVLRRSLYSDRPPRHEYLLTEKGRDLWSVVIMLRAWGEKWVPRDGPTDLRLYHKQCGAEMMPQLTCPECGLAMKAHDCKAVPNIKNSIPTTSGRSQ